MNNQIISKDKQYQTRDGRKVVILADNVPGTDYPVVGYVVDNDGTYHYQWTNEGKFISDYNYSYELDLFPAAGVIVEYAAVWDNTHDGDSGICGWSHAKPTSCGWAVIGYMVRTTEEGKQPVYHFEPV